MMWSDFDKSLFFVKLKTTKETYANFGSVLGIVFPRYRH